MPGKAEQMTKSSFAAHYDATSWIVTGLVFALTFGLAVIADLPILFVLPSGLLLAAYAWSPRGYEIADGELRIRRLVGTIAIPLESIVAARAAQGNDLKHATRVFGSGGVFGYYGKFHTSGLGNADWYMTNTKKAIVLRTATRTVLVSPDDGAGFLTALQAARPGLNEGSAEASGNFGKLPSPGYWKFVFVVVGLVAVMIGGLLLYSPGLPAVDLTASELVIHDKFYALTVKAADVDVAGVRVVDLKAEPEFRPVERTNGFANSHYRSGHFRLKNGQVVMLYNAGATRMVWLPVKSGEGHGQAVMLETADPEGFAERVKTSWGGQTSSGTGPN